MGDRIVDRPCRYAIRNASEQRRDRRSPADAARVNDASRFVGAAHVLGQAYEPTKPPAAAPHRAAACASVADMASGTASRAAALAAVARLRAHRSSPRWPLGCSPWCCRGICAALLACADRGTHTPRVAVVGPPPDARRRGRAQCPACPLWPSLSGTRAKAVGSGLVCREVWSANKGTILFADRGCAHDLGRQVARRGALRGAGVRPHRPDT